MISTHLSTHAFPGKEHDGADAPLGKGTTRASLPPSLFGGAGRTERDIDPITNRILHELFPPDRTAWATFLAGLLRHATIESSRDWAHVISFPVEGDVAVVSCTGVKDLSRKLGLAYATTHLYGTLFKAIGLLIEHQDHDHRRVILFPLSTYHLPVDLPTRLAQMKARSKDKQVHHLVNGILSHRSRPPRQESPRSAQQEITLQQLHTLQQILLSEGVADQDGRIAARIIAEVRRFASGDLVDSLAMDIIDEGQHQGAQRSIIAEEATAGSALATHGSQDSPQESTQESARIQPESRTGIIVQSDAFAPTNLMAAEASLDSPPHVSINGIGNLISGIHADSDSTDTVSGQDGCGVAKIPSPTHILSTRERRGLATDLAWIVEGKTDNVGAFITLLKHYDSQIILAAVIATLARKYAPCGMRPLDRPGGFCTNRCKEYQRTGIPDEIMTFIDSHQSITYEEIDRLLYQRAQEQKIQNKHIPYTALLKGTTGDIQDPPPPRRGTWMDRQTAEALAQRIPREAPGTKIVGVRDVQQGLEMVSVVDVEIAGALWTFTSPEDWLDYVITVRHLETLSQMER